MPQQPHEMSEEWVKGYKAACDLLINDGDNRYGIGSMCSQWTASEVGEDLKQRVVEAWNAGT